MRRALVLSALLAAVLALPVAAAQQAPPAALTAPSDARCADTSTPVPLAPAERPSPREALANAGLVPDATLAVDDLPTCPSVVPCGGGGPYVKCRNTNCSTTDLGYSACIAGSSAIKCPPGETIHVTNCNCQVAFQAYCCTHPPYCLCGSCNFSSQSVSCQ
ncbi:MAG: hypothetical protein PVG07_00610 [Acidobacteriota bacterium]|jgi:hypothetical protein